MSFLTINADLSRCARALERIADALDRGVGPPIDPAILAKRPRAEADHPIPQRQRQIMLDLIVQGLDREQALAMSKLPDIELMRKGIAIHPENESPDPDGDLDLTLGAEDKEWLT